MAPHSEDRAHPTGVEPGEFPFPIAYGTEESRYLTWIRNHSNYMAVRGLIDYVRLVAVLIRGAILNSLITVPWLLAAALVIAADRVYFRSSFTLSGYAVVIGTALVLIWPIATHFLAIYNYRSTRATGSENTAEARDRTQTVFAIALIAIFVALSIDGLAALLDRYHRIVDEGNIGFPEVAGLGGAAVAAYSISDRLLDKLGGKSRQLALLAIGALGVVIPAILVIHLAHFVIFDREGHAYGEMALIAGVVIFLVVGLLLFTGFVRRAFSMRDAGAAVLIVGLLVGGIGWMLDMRDSYDQNLYVAVSNVRRLALHPESWPDATDSLQARGFIPQADSARKERDSVRTEFAQMRSFYAAHAGGEIDRLREELLTFRRERRLIPPTTGVCGSRPPVLTKQNCDGLMALAKRAADAGIIGMQSMVQDIGQAEVPPGANADTANMLAALALQSFAHLDEEIRTLGRLYTARDGPRDTLALRALDAAHVTSEEGVLDPLANWLTLANSIHIEDRYGEFATALYRLMIPAATWDEMFQDVGDEFAILAVYTPSKYPHVFAATHEARKEAYLPKMQLFFIIGLVIYGFTWIAVDVNQTSVHGLWRDRLAGAFLVGADRKGDVEIEEDVDLADLSRHEAGSVAPYHLINVALNLHASDDIDLRDRRSDFFIFSKRFTGSHHTGYCRSDLMERVFPHMGLGAAMAISAAAASPNMGRETNPALVALMTLLNIRLGVWVPNPGRLQEQLEPHKRKAEDEDGSPAGFSFYEAFREELPEIKARWKNLRFDDKRTLAPTDRPSADHGLIGLAFSGGGIRSATLNLGIVQALHARNVFDHVDYLSTVSGGGFIGSSISSIMRAKVPTEAKFGGVASVKNEENGEVSVTIAPKGGLMDAIPGMTSSFDTPQHCRFAKGTLLRVADGERVYAGQRLVRTRADADDEAGSFGELYRWRVPPRALLWELMSKLDEKWKWVNVSDGGHIENLATMELLRRRCKYIIMGDGEADPTHKFTGLATVIRTARLDLGVEININVDPLRLDANGNTKGHWAAGTIEYPPFKPGDPVEHGWILYFKSSITGKEDEVIREYRRGSPTFPHESTADQSFTEGQFEAYRSLGAQIAFAALQSLKSTDPGSLGRSTYADIETWMRGLTKVQREEALEQQQRLSQPVPQPA